jgi:hypothetical protein
MKKPTEENMEGIPSWMQCEDDVSSIWDALPPSCGGKLFATYTTIEVFNEMKRILEDTKDSE